MGEGNLPSSVWRFLHRNHKEWIWRADSCAYCWPGWAAHPHCGLARFSRNWQNNPFEKSDVGVGRGELMEGKIHIYLLLQWLWDEQYHRDEPSGAPLQGLAWIFRAIGRHLLPARENPVHHGWLWEAEIWPGPWHQLVQWLAAAMSNPGYPEQSAAEKNASGVFSAGRTGSDRHAEEFLLVAASKIHRPLRTLWTWSEAVFLPLLPGEE